MPDALDPEDAKLVTLARSSRARNGAAEGAAVRDRTGRTYVATTVELPTLRLTALQSAVAAAVSSGVDGLEAAAVVSETGASDALGADAVRDLAGAGCPLLLADASGTVVAPHRTCAAPGADTSRSKAPGADPQFRAGFVCLVGRPNTGKSTLVNAMVGKKVVITSSKPQTTRRVVRGIVNRPEGQLVMVDTPGVHRPRTLLGSRLNDEARAAIAEVDVKVLTVPADEPVGPGDRFIAEQLVAPGRAPRMVAVTKADTVRPDAMAVQLLAVTRLGEDLGFGWDEVVPVSARDGFQVDLLTSLLLGQVPASPPLFETGDDAAVTDLPIDEWVAELVREAALEGVQDELPHSLAVVVTEMNARDDRPADRPLTDVHATVYVERDSQKAIVIGHRGERLVSVGRRARAEIEQVLGTAVYLDLHVTVAKDWQRDPRQLRKLGF